MQADVHWLRPCLEHFADQLAIAPLGVSAINLTGAPDSSMPDAYIFCGIIQCSQFNRDEVSVVYFHVKPTEFNDKWIVNHLGGLCFVDYDNSNCYRVPLYAYSHQAEHIKSYCCGMLES